MKINKNAVRKQDILDMAGRMFPKCELYVKRTQFGMKLRVLSPCCNSLPVVVPIYNGTGKSELRRLLAHVTGV